MKSFVALLVAALLVGCKDELPKVERFDMSIRQTFTITNLTGEEVELVRALMLMRGRQSNEVVEITVKPKP